MLIARLLKRYLTTFGDYVMLMGRVFSRPERLRMFMKKYVKEMSQLGVDSIGIVLLIGDLHTDEDKHFKSVDAAMDDRLRDARNHVAGVFEQHHVPYFSRESWFKHRVGTRHDARDAAD